MGVVVGIDVGAYKHAAAVCRSGAREAEKRVLRLGELLATRGGWLHAGGPNNYTAGGGVLP